MWTHGKFYWNELMTHDIEAAKKFYGQTIGWTFESMPHPAGTYWVAKLGGESVAGLFPMSGPDFAAVPEHWFSYIAVDDVDARLKKAIALGGNISYLTSQDIAPGAPNPQPPSPPGTPGYYPRSWGIWKQKAMGK